MIKIITNNPAVRDKYVVQSAYFETDVLGVYTKIRDEVHLGAEIISHPLSGSIKPWETPYKSVVIKKRSAPCDLKSLQLIEDALATLLKATKKNYKFTQQMLEDFGIIDLDLVNSAMESPITM